MCQDEANKEHNVTSTLHLRTNIVITNQHIYIFFSV